MAVAFWIAPAEPEAAAPVELRTVRAIVDARCLSCHAGATAPNGASFETDGQLSARAPDIAAQLAARAMPPGNVTRMTDEERAQVIAWAEQVR